MDLPPMCMLDHFVMRCRKQSKSRRDAFPSAREKEGLGVTAVVKKWPNRVLEFSRKDKFLDKNSYHVFGINSVHP